MNKLHALVLFFLELTTFTSLLGQQQDEQHKAFVSQLPEYEVLFPGESSKFDCFYCIPGITVNNHLIYWYKESPDFRRVATVSNNALIYTGHEYENRLQIINKEEHLSSLIIKNLSTSDNGVFYCEVIRTSPPPAMKMNGSGTNITVQEKEKGKRQEKENEELNKNVQANCIAVPGTCLSYTPVIVVATVAGAAILLLVTVLIIFVSRNSWSSKSSFPEEAYRTGLQASRRNRNINVEEERPYQVLIYEKDRTLHPYMSYSRKGNEKSPSDTPKFDRCK